MEKIICRCGKWLLVLGTLTRPHSLKWPPSMGWEYESDMQSYLGFFWPIFVSFQNANAVLSILSLLGLTIWQFPSPDWLESNTLLAWGQPVWGKMIDNDRRTNQLSGTRLSADIPLYSAFHSVGFVSLFSLSILLWCTSFHMKPAHKQRLHSSQSFCDAMTFFKGKSFRSRHSNGVCTG